MVSTIYNIELALREPLREHLHTHKALKVHQIMRMFALNTLVLLKMIYYGFLLE